MSRNVSEAAKGSGDISQNIQGVAEAAEGTTRGAQDAQKAAVALSEMSSQLKHLVGQFKLADSQEAHAKGHGAGA
jgi:methyl-accepting chemotaxis protein